MNIEETLSSIRKKHRLTQAEFAQRLFVTVPTVSRWENGEAFPSEDTLHLISKTFDISMDALTGREMQASCTDAEINSERFLGFADIYDFNRPTVPKRCIEIITNYLGGTPKTVVDLGCGTGLSTQMWQGSCEQIIGVEPGEDMLRLAKAKALPNTAYVQAYSHRTGLPNLRRRCSLLAILSLDASAGHAEGG